MKFNRIAEKAKQALDRRGGIDALKEDLQEVKQAATGRGSFRDKARAAAEAIMDRLVELRARCQRHANSLVTPMGDEMRYQQTLIDEATTTVGALLQRPPSQE